MAGEVVTLPCFDLPEAEDFAGRLKRVAALFGAIEAGELLSAFPDCPIAQQHHALGLRLLAMIETEVLCLCDEIGP
jgi:hypothetical protein